MALANDLVALGMPPELALAIANAITTGNVGGSVNWDSLTNVPGNLTDLADLDSVANLEALADLDDVTNLEALADFTPATYSEVAEDISAVLVDLGVMEEEVTPP